jgi:flagellar biosynthesis repressor protein FlbT
MPGLILKLRAHEQILVNGVVMQNGDRNTRLIIKTPDARILRLRDAIQPDEATTPVKRACYLAQLAVSGECGAAEAAEQLAAGFDGLRAWLPVCAAGEHIDEARSALAEGNHYAVLRALRRLVPLEEAQQVRGQATPCARHATRAAGTPA